MKKINYYLNDNNVIIGYNEIPFDESLPYLELEDSVNIYVNFSQVIDGNFIQNEDAYQAYKIQNDKVWKAILRIEELKKALADLDFKTNKYIEGLLTDEEWSEIKATRQSYRKEINELEEFINQNR